MHSASAGRQRDGGVLMKKCRIIRVLMLLVAMLLISQLAGCSLVDEMLALIPTSTSTEQNEVVSGFLSQDHSCWFPIQNDECAVHIEGDVDTAYLSRDRESIVVLETDGYLYWTTPENPETKTGIAETAGSIVSLKNDGVVYTDTATDDSVYYRYDFETGSSIELGTGDISLADDTTSALICDDDGVVWLLPAGETTPERIGQYDGTLAACAVDNEGKLGVWTASESGQKTVYLCDSGEREKLETINNIYNSTFVYFSRDNSAMFVGNTGAEYVFLKRAGEDTARIALPNDVDYASPCTENDLLTADQNVDEKSSIYVCVVNDDNSDLFNVYWVNFYGERERIVSAVQDYRMKDGVIYYIDEDDDLRCAALDGSRVSDERKIAGNVVTITASPSGAGVLYGKNVGDDSIGSLYYYAYKDDASSRITAGAPFYRVVWNDELLLTIDFSEFSSDGKYIYYLDNGVQVEDTFGVYGTLCRYKIRDGSIEQLTTMTMGLFDSGRRDYTIDEDFLWGQQFFSYENDTLMTDLFVFDHGQKVTIAQDIVS